MWSYRSQLSTIMNILTIFEALEVTKCCATCGWALRREKLLLVCQKWVIMISSMQIFTKVASVVCLGNMWNLLLKHTASNFLVYKNTRIWTSSTRVLKNISATFDFQHFSNMLPATKNLRKHSNCQIIDSLPNLKKFHFFSFYSDMLPDLLLFSLILWRFKTIKNSNYITEFCLICTKMPYILIALKRCLS